MMVSRWSEGILVFGRWFLVPRNKSKGRLCARRGTRRAGTAGTATAISAMSRGDNLSWKAIRGNENQVRIAVKKAGSDGHVVAASMISGWWALDGSTHDSRLRRRRGRWFRRDTHLADVVLTARTLVRCRRTVGVVVLMKRDRATLWHQHKHQQTFSLVLELLSQQTFTHGKH